MNHNFDILSNQLKDVIKFFESLPLPKFKAKQTVNWIHNRGSLSYEEMTDLSKDDRAKLNQIAPFYIPPIIKTDRSKDGTIKFLLKLADNNLVETVLIPEARRSTVCLSSQIGCKLKCKFCVTALDGLIRNLTSSEIIGSFLAIKRATLDKPITNIVFMGMGEPLDNYENLIRALKILTDPDSMLIGGRKITVSTSGISDKIEQLASDFPKIKLAVSINAVSNGKRSKLMPINKKFPIESIFHALRKWEPPKGRKLTFEYLLIKDLTDSLEDAAKLDQLTKSIRSVINLIPYNSSPYIDLQPSSKDQIKRFQEELIKRNRIAIIRESRGKDINAACGLLKKHAQLSES
ncbi:MAG: 23S rRNA (adenine(2503)-C(2))-methyltransferase RlmN [Nitrospinota bacterium]